MKPRWTRNRRGGAGCLGWFLLITLVAAVIARTPGSSCIPASSSRAQSWPSARARSERPKDWPRLPSWSRSRLPWRA